MGLGHYNRDFRKKSVTYIRQHHLSTVGDKFLIECLAKGNIFDVSRYPKTKSGDYLIVGEFEEGYEYYSSEKNFGYVV